MTFPDQNFEKKSMTPSVLGLQSVFFELTVAITKYF